MTPEPGEEEAGGVRHRGNGRPVRRVVGMLPVLALLVSGHTIQAASASSANASTAPSDGSPRARSDSVPMPLRGKLPWSSSDASAAPFPVRLDDEDVGLALTFHVLLPGETLTITAPVDASLAVDAGRLVARSPGRWAWVAPDTPGIRWLRIRGSSAGTVDVALLVAHPARRVSGDVLDGYRIGRYRPVALRGDPAYLPPPGFVEVRPEDEDIRVSPHFTLGEFLCKQPGDPRYLVLSRPLVLKLEQLLSAANGAGLQASGLTVMSGFRTPFYNRSIGNTTDYSRHLWGDAADVFIDQDGDGEMDDLNGDGRRDVADARVLARVVEGLAADPPDGYAPGGLATYRRNPVHGPFVHVDARGTPARW